MSVDAERETENDFSLGTCNVFESSLFNNK